MNFVWCDYQPDTMGYVENWLDESAVRTTGMDDGCRDFFEYWANDGGLVLGENYWCKVIFENGEPFAVIAFSLHDGIACIMEILVAPEKRGQGKGTALLKDLLNNGEEIFGAAVKKSEAVIFPSNKASQKAFEKAGFTCHRIHEDGDAMDYVYERDFI